MRLLSFLRKNNADHESIALANYVGILVLSSTGRVVHCNEMAREALEAVFGNRSARFRYPSGKKLSELLGVPLYETVIGRTLLTGEEQTFRSILLKGRKYYVITRLMYAEDGRRISGCIGYYFPDHQCRYQREVDPVLNERIKEKVSAKGYIDLDWIDHITVEHAMQLRRCLEHNEHAVDFPQYCPFGPDCAFNPIVGWQRLNRRRYTRLPVCIPCEVYPVTAPVEDDTVTIGFDAEIVDISLGGVRLRSNRHLPIKSTIRLKIKERVDLELQGQIVWQRQADDLWFHGIRFDHLPSYARAAVMRIVHNAAQSARRVNSPRTCDSVSRVVSNPEARRSLSIATGLLRAKDETVYKHCLRTACLAQTLGKTLGLGEKQVKILADAARIHDFGKLEIDRRILRKPTPLTQEEWKKVKLHAEYGAKLVSGIYPLQGLAPLVRHHHEHYDGSGYPDGLRGSTIPRLARILAVADAIDAMAHPRPYRETPLTKTEIVEVLRRESGRQFDPEVAGKCIELIASDSIHFR